MQKPVVVSSKTFDTSMGDVEFERFTDGTVLITLPRFNYVEINGEDAVQLVKLLGFHPDQFEEFKKIELQRMSAELEARIRKELEEHLRPCLEAKLREDLEPRIREEIQEQQLIDQARVRELMDRLTKEDLVRGICPSDQIKRLVSLEENGTWGANVGVCTTGEARIVRYYYDKRVTARNAKFTDKIGENGRVA